jgi:hypothetical protein
MMRDRNTNKRKALLKNWALLPSRRGNGYAHLSGQVYGHPSFFNGETVTTSPCIRIDFERMEAETMHTIYMLGEV